ncbi:MDR family MFS transporter [Actinoplanes utahensis]|uniref:MFS transporter n=1 Tax=Actinoplanes utahensis TaxID=1869 RepID=A0A0A6UBW7_ACTUT|nr:MFS transporter [Actinoplanes utahensis]KHD72573.1 MFS transporter [Actinoplanes utahensis]GIF29300.1 MFS transporter [Actinoplanes utahensis]
MRGWLRQAAGGLPRQFWFLWTGTLINRLGSFVVLFLSIYLTAERGFSQSQAGLILGFYGLGGAIGTLTGGVLTDRWGRRPTMLIAQFGAAALMLALGLAESYLQIAGAAFLLGMFAEAARPAFSAMMVDIVPEHDRVRAFSLNYWAINLGFALAAIIAGFAAQVDYLLLFVGDAVSTLVTAIITAIFLAETRPAGPRRREAGPGLGTALRDPVFGVYLLLSLATVMVFLQHLSTLPISMLADGHSAATYGAVIAVNGVLIVIGQLFVPRLIQGRDSARVLAVAAVLVGCGFGLVAVARTPWMYAVTVVIWTLGEMLQSPSNAATVAALSPPGLRGRYQGLNSLSWSAGTALAPILGGLILQEGGDAVLWGGCFVLCVLVAVAQLLAGPARARRAARLRAAQEEIVTVPA